jgi:hypothetical protein
MAIFLIVQYFFGGGIGGFSGPDDAFTFSIDFGKSINPNLNIGTKLTMSFTGNAPDYYDIPFYYWGDPGEYPEELFAEYKERNEVGAQIVARKYLKNFFLIGLTGFSMQEYITLPLQDSLSSLPPYPVGERDEYSLVYGAGMGIRVAKFDFCFSYTNKYGILFYITREFGYPHRQKSDGGEVD